MIRSFVADDGLAPPLERGSCHVWWAKPADSNPLLLNLMDAPERVRLKAVRRALDRDRFVVACGILRLALAAYLETPPTEIGISRACLVCGEPHGKPRLSQPALATVEISVSHARDQIAVAFALETPIGIDVEQVHTELPIEAMSHLVLTTQESLKLGRLPRNEQVRGFLIFWTRKEAMVKATGIGLEMPLTSFVVSGTDEPPRLISWPHDSEMINHVSLYDLDAGNDHVASLAVIGRCSRVVALNGSALLASWALDPDPRGDR